ncbi:plasmid replication protein RepC [Oceaniglobus ichthyenteri]|uniref:plasmid replication protein RepC n=1 Tax=Oceaniglobus ichthyenteri TaxID=2136177 RepID=UPI000D34371E|nr:plasmid replication protein RepC [Oceaniglobus ichthyenteri]
MTYIPITPFRGTVADIGLSIVSARPAPPETSVDKWELLRDVTTARTGLGVSDRELAVLQVLLSFYPHRALSSRDIVVFPSNASICERLNGMPCSTMRRRLTGLVRAGLITRRDSPNGKRFARRHGDGAQAFGFDLSPLLHRHDEICAHAEQARTAEQELARLRQSISLMRRDLSALITYGHSVRPALALWDQATDLAALTARAMRRRLTSEHLQQIAAQLSATLAEIRTVLTPETSEMDTKAIQNEQHHQRSDKDIFVSDSCLEEKKSQQQDQSESPALPLALVLRACPQIAVFGNRTIRRWYDLIAAADGVYPMMGVSATAWADATRVMGAEQASIVIAAMLERIGSIKSPGGYLRHLTRRAEEGAFTCSSMIKALLNRAPV